MTKPLPCPGECIYCPGVSCQPGEKVAQSYTGREPALWFYKKKEVLFGII